MNAPFELRVDPGGGPQGMPLVTVEGEIDLAAASRLDQALRATAGPGGQVAVDLSGVDYLDTAGVRVLLDQAARVRLVVLLPADGIVAPVIATSGLARVATVRTVGR